MTCQKGTPVSVLYFLLFALASAQTDSAAIDSFDIEDYIRPSLRYQTLTIMPSMDISSETLYDSYNDSTRFFSSYSGLDFPGISVNPGIATEMNFNNSNKYYEINHSHYLSPHGYASRTSKFDNNFENTKGLANHKSQLFNILGLTRTSYTYYFPRNFFTRASLTLFGSANFLEKSIVESKQLTRLDSLWFYTYNKMDSEKSRALMNMQFSTSCGFGRVHDVTAAAVALNILDMVKKHPHNQKAIDLQKIQDFASFLDLRHNRRIFDSRNAFIEDIDTICRYLKEKSMVDSLSPTLVMEISDQYHYEFYRNRKSGLKFEVYPQLNIRYNRDSLLAFERSGSESIKGDSFTKKQINDLPPPSTLTIGNHSYNVEFGYDYYFVTQLQYCRPWRRVCQIEGTIRATAGLLNIISRRHSSDGSTEKRLHLHCTYPSVGLEADAQLSYYPMTRTEFSLNPTVSIQRDYRYTEKKYSGSGNVSSLSLPIKNFKIQAMVIGRCIYTASPRLQHNFSIQTSGWFINNNKITYPQMTKVSEKDKHFQYMVSWRISYSLW